MKRCPQCDLTYIDDSLNFCLTDGAPLTPTVSQNTMSAGESQNTVVLPTPPVGRKSRLPLWVGLGVLVALLGIGTAAVVLVYVLSGKGEIAGGNRSNTSPAPKPSPTPKPMASPSVTSSPAAEPTPSPAGISKPSPDDDDNDIDEVTPIAWSTAAFTFKGDTGQIYKFLCPEKGTPSAIWGSDIYTQDSSICTAAVHAGVITVERGGEVTIEFRPGRKTYGSTERNGITSNTFGEYSKSFVVR